MTSRIVMFSGGVGSWAAAKRVVERYGVDELTLLFADTLMEDEDLYRFIEQAAVNVSGEPKLLRIAEGRNPWQIFFDERMLGNSFFDPCSKKLKREMVDRWLVNNCDPRDTVVYVGIDWTEEHRFTRLRDRRAEVGWCYEAPLCEPPLMMKDAIFEWLGREGLAPPRLYDLGFSHNNCGGFCIKAGHAHFSNLLRVLPSRYAYHEAKEQEIRNFLGRDVSIMTDRSGDGKKKPFTLRALRERIEAGDKVDQFDVGGCGCFVDTETT
jgi:hypothetical protein